FAANSTMRSWKKAMNALIPMNAGDLSAFDELRAGGVHAETTEWRDRVIAAPLFTSVLVLLESVVAHTS
ncbi:MAG: amino acid dehydrogenase, partial [Ornithinimicrobium sp.]